jgi:hypothetical protein
LARLLLSELGGNKVETKSSPIEGDVVETAKLSIKKKYSSGKRMKKSKNNSNLE